MNYKRNTIPLVELQNILTHLGYIDTSLSIENIREILLYIRIIASQHPKLEDIVYTLSNLLRKKLG